MLLRTRAILVVVVGTVMGLSLSFSGGLLASRPQPQPDEDALQQARVLAEVMARVKRDYVEPVDDAILLENAIRGMVGDLDAYSQYLDADEYRDIRISTTGSYTGIGIEIGELDGQVRIITPIAGSPAARAGLRSGDSPVSRCLRCSRRRRRRRGRSSDPDSRRHQSTVRPPRSPSPARSPPRPAAPQTPEL